MKAYLPYISIAGVCVAVWIIIQFGAGMLPFYSLPLVETIPLPDRILEIKMRQLKPTPPIRINAFLAPKKNISQAGFAKKGSEEKKAARKNIQERFKLQAIVVDGERRFAAIEGYSIVAEGDSLEEYVVTAIGVDAVRLEGPDGDEVLDFENAQLR